MSSTSLEQFMWWVPLLGSALGNVLMGMLSDRVVRLAALAETASAASATDTAELGEDEVGSGQLELVPAAGARCDDAPQPNAKEDASEVCGVSRRARVAAAGRFLVCGLGNLAALPFVWLALSAPYPYCFLAQVPSGFLAEAYLAQTITVVSDAALTGVPAQLGAPAVALFMLLATLLASCVPLLVPLLRAVIGYDEPIEVYIEAAPSFTTNTSTATGELLLDIRSSPDLL
jgi:hypothetical protein